MLGDGGPVGQVDRDLTNPCPAARLIQTDGGLELGDDIEDRIETPGDGVGRRHVEKGPADTTAPTGGRHQQSGHHSQALDRLLQRLGGHGHDRSQGAPVQGDVAGDLIAVFDHPGPVGVGGIEEGAEIGGQVRRIPVELVGGGGQGHAAVEVGLGPSAYGHHGDVDERYDNEEGATPTPPDSLLA
jgi:hypothetical protein